MMKWDDRSEFTHSVWFQKNGESTPRNSMEDFWLFPDKRFTFKVGDPDFLNEEIEGKNGSYDWWHIVATPVKNKEASDTLTFKVLSEYHNYNWVDEYDSLVSYFDGSIFKFWFNDEPDEVATGRIWIGSDGWNSPSGELSSVTLNYTMIKEVEHVE